MTNTNTAEPALAAVSQQVTDATPGTSRATATLLAALPGFFVVTLDAALAVAVFGALLAAPPGMATGMRISLLLAAAVAAAAAITTVAGLRARP